ncbi:MAG: DUF3141 domain-containing protein [Rickettsiales bacterium]|nr:DUF3141 domain-containing protein [Rickettsiales bacterium]
MNKQFSDYIADFNQRCILYTDVMRQRGNKQIDITNHKGTTVLSFEFEVILDGLTFERPINYWLAKIKAPAGVVTNDKKRPFVIQDPRAGQGPGIGGMKKDSEIGDALRNGHPVYFVGFNNTPVEGQTFEDIISGQLNFYLQIAEIHKDSPKMCAIGNCAAGYLTMFSAMQRPDIFGPIIIAGSPLSYWNGVRGTNPMRYSGGLCGGSWILSLLGDIGGGKFDGSYLIENFNNLNPANTLWSKQYNLFAAIDTEAERYLEFEKWWGDFIQFNTEEIKWLVDNLFVGNKLTTGRLITKSGIVLDPRAITSPIITFVSSGDNISPPAQSAGWIADLYHDEDEIRQSGKTIIYCLNHKVGHLAIFTASKVGKRENEAFVENIDSMDIMSPGLYELVIDTPDDQKDIGKIKSHYEPRTIKDIKALGWNTCDDDRAFATVAKASETMSNIYDLMFHPVFKTFSCSRVADTMKNMLPLHLSYTLFADAYNPWLKFVSEMSNSVKQARAQIVPDNYFLKLQQQYSDEIIKFLQSYSQNLSLNQERIFFDLWTNPIIQKLLGTDKEKPRLTPSMIQAGRNFIIQNTLHRIKANLVVTNNVQALYRIVRLIIEFRKNKIIPELLVRTLVAEAKKMEPTWSDNQIHEIIRDQALVVSHDPEAAILALKNYFNQNKNGIAVMTVISEISDKLGGVSQQDVKEAVNELIKKLGL